MDYSDSCRAENLYAHSMHHVSINNFGSLPQTQTWARPSINGSSRISLAACIVFMCSICAVRALSSLSEIDLYHGGRGGGHGLSGTMRGGGGGIFPILFFV